MAWTTPKTWGTEPLTSTDMNPRRVATGRYWMASRGWGRWVWLEVV